MLIQKFQAPFDSIFGECLLAALGTMATFTMMRKAISCLLLGSYQVAWENDGCNLFEMSVGNCLALAFHFFLNSME